MRSVLFNILFYLPRYFAIWRSTSYLSLELPILRTLPLRAKLHSSLSSTCCHPSITRTHKNILDLPSKTKARIQHANSTRMSSGRFSGMRNMSATSRDRSNWLIITNRKTSNTEFLKKSLIIPKMFPSLQNLLQKKKILNSRLSRPIRLIAKNLWNSSNKKLKINEGNKRSFWRLWELRYKKIK